MAKIVKKTKKKSLFERFILCFFVVSSLLFIASFTYVKANNVVLAKRENQIERENDILSNDVANLELKVKQLDNRERVLSIVEKAGLEVNQENIISVAAN